ncbi:TPA: hypothetical protein ACH3X3_014510 [Trebouxia sp. C0006]
MSLIEQNASKQLQQCASKSDGQLSGWGVKTGSQGVYYLHEDSSLAVQNLGVARVAMQVFSQINQGDIASTEHIAENDGEDEERDELLSLCSCLDGVISHLQKQVETLKAYQRQPQACIEATGAVHSKIVDIAWRKELDKQKVLKDDADTDLYATGIAEQDVAQAPEEEGSPLGDDFVICEGLEMAKLSLKLQKISDALDLVPVS